MIIVKLQGGLGNQMFQYAAGRALAAQSFDSLKLDVSAYRDCSGVTQRQYELSAFNIKEEFASLKEDKILNSHGLHGVLKKIIDRFRVKLWGYNYAIESHGKFRPDIFGIKGNIYLDGYWQTEKYFLKIANIIRSEFSIKKEYSNVNLELLNRIRLCDSIAVHIRRGDYVSNADINAQHGTCSLEYYEKAIDYMTEKIVNPTLYIFSDDIIWCKNNLKTNLPTFYAEGNTAHEDLFLMSECKHNIIANSSFSWWSAWLNNNVNKIVVAPKKWFNKSNIESMNIVPDNWIKI